jgi:hypothetical protein
MKWAWTGKDVTADELAAQVGPGWCGIVHRLVADLLELGWDGEVFQVKEKFGGLRFYIRDSTPAMSNRIFMAEGQSYRTCEQCGEPGVIRGDRSWILTLCDTCNVAKSEGVHGK